MTDPRRDESPEHDQDSEPPGDGITEPDQVGPHPDPPVDQESAR